MRMIKYRNLILTSETISRFIFSTTFDLCCFLELRLTVIHPSLTLRRSCEYHHRELAIRHRGSGTRSRRIMTEPEPEPECHDSRFNEEMNLGSTLAEQQKIEERRRLRRREKVDDNFDDEDGDDDDDCKRNKQRKQEQTNQSGRVITFLHLTDDVLFRIFEFLQDNHNSNKNNKSSTSAVLTVSSFATERTLSSSFLPSPCDSSPSGLKDLASLGRTCKLLFRLIFTDCRTERLLFPMGGRRHYRNVNNFHRLFTLLQKNHHQGSNRHTNKQRQDANTIFPMDLNPGAKSIKSIGILSPSQERNTVLVDNRDIGQSVDEGETQRPQLPIPDNVDPCQGYFGFCPLPSDEVSVWGDFSGVGFVTSTDTFLSSCKKKSNGYLFGMSLQVMSIHLDDDYLFLGFASGEIHCIQVRIEQEYNRKDEKSASTLPPEPQQSVSTTKTPEDSDATMKTEKKTRTTTRKTATKKEQTTTGKEQATIEEYPHICTNQDHPDEITSLIKIDGTTHLASASMSTHSHILVHWNATRDGELNRVSKISYKNIFVDDSSLSSSTSTSILSLASINFHGKTIIAAGSNGELCLTVLPSHHFDCGRSQSRNVDDDDDDRHNGKRKRIHGRKNAKGSRLKNLLDEEQLTKNTYKMSINARAVEMLFYHPKHDSNFHHRYRKNGTNRKSYFLQEEESNYFHDYYQQDLGFARVDGQDEEMATPSSWDGPSLLIGTSKGDVILLQINIDSNKIAVRRVFQRYCFINGRTPKKNNDANSTNDDMSSSAAAPPTVSVSSSPSPSIESFTKFGDIVIISGSPDGRLHCFDFHSQSFFSSAGKVHPGRFMVGNERGHGRGVEGTSRRTKFPCAVVSTYFCDERSSLVCLCRDGHTVEWRIEETLKKIEVGLKRERGKKTNHTSVGLKKKRNAKNFASLPTIKSERGNVVADDDVKNNHDDCYGQQRKKKMKKTPAAVVSEAAALSSTTSNAAIATTITATACLASRRSSRQRKKPEYSSYIYNF